MAGRARSKTTGRKRPGAKRAAAKRPGAKRAAAKRPGAKKAAAKRPAAKMGAKKKTATKSPSAKRPAAKRPTAKRPTAKRPLDEYRRKRDFTKTAEPSGDEVGAPKPQRTRSAKPLRFVIQKHAASHLHFDFRLELDGVMKSWAVPKGPSLDTRVRRLAMQVEDHPISYNSFEGTIPKGQYGGGTVMLWDRGHYLPADGDVESLRRGLARGRIDIVMLGDRLKGAFTMVRSGRDTEKPQWLLFKRTDEYADPKRDIVAEEVTSIESGRTMEEIASAKRGRVWQSNR